MAMTIMGEDMEKEVGVMTTTGKLTMRAKCIGWKEGRRLEEA